MGLRQQKCHWEMCTKSKADLKIKCYLYVQIKYHFYKKEVHEINNFQLTALGKHHKVPLVLINPCLLVLS